MSAALDRAADGIAAAILGAAAKAVVPQVAVGDVTDVAPGAGAGGVDLVTVTYNGGEVTIPHSGAYVPTVGDRVSLLRPAHQLIINDKILGGPVG